MSADLLAIRAACLMEALDRHEDDDRALALAERLERFLMRKEVTVVNAARPQKCARREAREPLKVLS